MVWDPPKQKVDVTRMLIYSFIPILGIYAAWRIQKFWLLLVLEFVMSIAVVVTLFPLGMIAPELVSLIPFPLGIMINILLMIYFAEKYNDGLGDTLQKKPDDKITNYIENYSNPIHSTASNTNNQNIPNIQNPIWYLLPLLLGIVGGIIAFMIFRNSDHEKAKRMLVIGIITSIPFFAWTSIQITYGSGNPIYVVASEGMSPELEMFDAVTVNSYVPFNEIDVEDIIVFNNPEDHNQVRISRVVSVIDDNPWTVRTQGDANLVSTPGVDFPITEKEYIGKVVGLLPQMGQFIATSTFYIILLAYVAMVFSYIAIEYNSFRKTSRSK